MPLINALSTKETVPQLHLGLLCVKLQMTIIHSPVLLVERNQQILLQLQTWPITLSLYQIRVIPFEIFIDEQVVAFMLEDKYTPKVPTCSVNAVLRNTVKHSIPAEEARQVVINAVLEKVWTSGYVDLHHIRNLYLISNTLGTHNSMAVNSELGILTKIPVNAE